MAKYEYQLICYLNKSYLEQKSDGLFYCDLMLFKYQQNTGKNLYILAKWPTFWPMLLASKVPMDVQIQTYN